MPNGTNSSTYRLMVNKEDDGEFVRFSCAVRHMCFTSNLWCNATPDRGSIVVPIWHIRTVFSFFLMPPIPYGTFTHLILTLFITFSFLIYVGTKICFG